MKNDIYFECDKSRRIALVRMVSNKKGGEFKFKRQYEYVRNGALPAFFPDGFIVPKKHRREILDFFNRLEN